VLLRCEAACQITTPPPFHAHHLYYSAWVSGFKSGRLFRREGRLHIAVLPSEQQKIKGTHRQWERRVLMNTTRKPPPSPHTQGTLPKTSPGLQRYLKPRASFVFCVSWHAAPECSSVSTSLHFFSNSAIWPKYKHFIFFQTRKPVK